MQVSFVSHRWYGLALPNRTGQEDYNQMETKPSTGADGRGKHTPLSIVLPHITILV